MELTSSSPIIAFPLQGIGSSMSFAMSSLRSPQNCTLTYIYNPNLTVSINSSKQLELTIILVQIPPQPNICILVRNDLFTPGIRKKQYNDRRCVTAIILIVHG